LNGVSATNAAKGVQIHTKNFTLNHWTFVSSSVLFQYLAP